MTFFSRVLAPRASIEDPNTALTGTQVMDFLGGPKSWSGKRITELTALGSAAVWRAMQLSTSVPAALPFGAFRPSDDGTSRMPAGPTTQARRLMAEPHPDMTRFEFWQLVHVHRRMWGNAYLRTLRNPAGQIVEMWHIHPSRVKVGRINEIGPKVYLVDGTEVLTDREVLHFPGMGYDGICGVGVIRAARESIGLGLAAEEFGARLFGSGALASGVLQTEQRLTQTQADALADRWKAKRAGLEQSHNVIVIDKGAKFEKLTIPPDDAQFLETRRFQVTEVCRWFGIPPFLMFETETSTSWGTGLQTQAEAWVKFDLATDLVPVEQRMSKVLFPQPMYAKHNVEGLLRGDPAQRSAFYKAMWEIGVLSTNEVRAKEELAPVEGGDMRYRPLNMGELGTADTEASKPTFDRLTEFLQLEAA